MQRPDRSIDLDGPFLKSFDFEAHGGQGEIEVTRDPAKAMRFEDARAAVVFTRTVPKCKPLRADGKPNRPLTALTISIEEAPS